MNPRKALPLLLLLASASLQAKEFRIADRDSEGLVAALRQANRSATPTTIRLAPNGLYTLTRVADDTSGSGLPVINARVILIGNRAEIRRYAEEPFHLLSIGHSGRLDMRDLSLAEGAEGAVVNHGRLEMTNVRVIDNTARRRQAIIENYGDMHIVGGEISFNRLDGAERDAGTILNYSRLDIEGTTFAGNGISTRYDSLLGATAVLNYGALQLHRVEISQNSAWIADRPDSVGSVLNLGMASYIGDQVRFSENEPDDLKPVITRLSSGRP